MRRGFSLLEALISLALLLVVLSAVGMVCSGVWRSQSFAAEKDLASATELRMLEVGHECVEAREWLSPATAVPVSNLKFRKLDPEKSHDPPLDLDRLSRQPLPPPSSWDGFRPDLQITVTYFYNPTRGQLLRQVDPGGSLSEVAGLAQNLRCQRLGDGRLRVEYSYLQEGKTVQRSLCLLGVLP